ncbi:MAG: hypothetical protein KAT77_01025 [Nanoarchaeota archaeon]|nr:hypothetical protein [Nanoarchaeota archaeon]
MEKTDSFKALLARVRKKRGELEVEDRQETPQRPRPKNGSVDKNEIAKGLGIFDRSQQTFTKRKTQALKAEELKEKAFLASLKYNAPYNVYNHGNHQDSPGFDYSRNAISHIVQFNEIHSSLEAGDSLDDCVKNHILDGEDQLIEEDSNKKKEESIHYFLSACLGLYKARIKKFEEYEKKAKEKPKDWDAAMKNAQKAVDLTQKLAFDTAQKAFIRRNHHIPEEKLIQLCEKGNHVYEVFQKTIKELSDLFAQYFSQCQSAEIGAYYTTIHQNGLAGLFKRLEYSTRLFNSVTKLPK